MNFRRRSGIVLASATAMVVDTAVLALRVRRGSHLVVETRGRAGQESLPVGKFDVAFAPQINQYNGRTSVQLKVLDWKAA